MTKRKIPEPQTITYTQTEENFSPERLDVVFDFLFKKTEERLDKEDSKSKSAHIFAT